MGECGICAEAGCRCHEKLSFVKQRTFKIWAWTHKWTSIVSTLFLIMLCVTGLPLIFHDEIDALTQDAPDFALPGVGSSSDDLRLLPLDAVLALALEARAEEVPVFMAFDNDSPLITVTTAPSPHSPPEDMTITMFDRSSGEPAGLADEGGVMPFLLQLHTDMFLGLFGMYFLGFTGVMFAASLVSGTVIYAPFMRKLDFGTLRVSRSKRVKWLDYHNLLGIVALAWAMVVGLTGVINALATPIVETWQSNGLTEMAGAYVGQEPLPPSRYGSVDKAMASAREVLPGNNPQFIAFPGGSYSSPHHYAVFFQGDSALTERLLTPALVDAETGVLTDSRSLPWYMQALLVSQPLHFGDYGGLPLKVLWAVLDIFTILILGSGIYLWLGRGNASATRQAAKKKAAL